MSGAKPFTSPAPTAMKRKDSHSIPELQLLRSKPGSVPVISISPIEFTYGYAHRSCSSNNHDEDVKDLAAIICGAFHHQSLPGNPRENALRILK